MSTKPSALHHRLPGHRKSTELREVMSRAGIDSNDSGRGQMTDKEFVADVTLQPDDFLTVRASAGRMFEPLAALERSGELPGNARLAFGGNGWQLAAETRVNGLAHLPASLQEIRSAFRHGLTGHASSAKRDSPDVDPTVAVHRTIKDAGWSEEQIVETNKGWEMQPRLAGETVPVKLRICGNNAQILCSVLSSLPSDTVIVRPLAHQASLFNGRLRFARLSVVGDRLIAETHLRAELINASWLAFAARAVASVTRSVTPIMKLIAHERSVADHYTALILRD